MKAKSIHSSTFEGIKTKLNESISDGFVPTLAFIFVSIKQDLKKITTFFDKKGITVFGASSAGEFTGNEITDGSIAVLMMDIDKSCFKVIIKDVGETNTQEKSEELGKQGKNYFKNPAFIISASSLDISGELMITGFLSSLGEDATIIGGASGDDYSWKGGYVFTNNKMSAKGISALVLDQNKIIVKGEAISGWKAIGTPKKVTHAEGSWVYTIEDKPALDMLLKYTGIKVNLSNENSIFEQIGTSYPLQVLQEKGYPIMKPPILFNKENGAVKVGGIIQTGDMIRFSLPPDFDVIETVIESATSIKDNSLQTADAIILFSCIGRRSCFGPLIDEEISGLKDVWDAPLAGFFTYGEFGTPPGGKANYHGGTVSWVALKEKK